MFKQKDVFFSGFNPKKNLLKNLAKEAKEFKHKDERILLSFTHDPYMNHEVASLTHICLDILKSNQCCFQILTKNGILASHDFGLYDKHDAFATTLTFWNEEDSRRIEQYASSPKDRISYLMRSKECGITTWVSFEPVIDEQSVFKLYEETKDFVDLYKVGKVSQFKSNVKNWKAFGNEMVSRFERDEKAYYIKQDLREEMER